MDVNLALPLLGGLSPAAFMRRHWQKKPLLVRQAWPGIEPPLPRAALFALAARDGVESRLVEQRPQGWHVRQGPLPVRALPPRSRPRWTLLVQGVDHHVPAAYDLLRPFRFIPDARLDDLMLSWASPGGGVGPHADSYDVFLLQAQGRRRWRVAPPPAGGCKPAFVEGAPLRLLRDFAPTEEWLLAPGDMLYLPPGWGHEGTAEGGDCVTCSIGFRAPSAGELVRELLSRLADEEEQPRESALYRDPRQPATQTPAAMPEPLLDYAQAAVERRLNDPLALRRVLGELLTEPKPQVWFDPRPGADPAGDARRLPGRSAESTADNASGPVALDPRTRMLYDEHHLFINGEAYRAGGRDAIAMRRLADLRRLQRAERSALSTAAARWLDSWIEAGWVHPEHLQTT